MDVHETHGKQERRQNLIIAKFLAARGECVRLLAVLRIPGKCADASRNGVEWEFKSLESTSANAIDTALRHASRQASCILLHLPTTAVPAVVEGAVFNRLRRMAHVVQVVILKNDVLYEFTREEILQNVFRGKIK